MNKKVLVLSSSPRKRGNSDLLCDQENSKPAMERTVEEFRGFTYCLDGPEEKGIIYGVRAWNKGEIKGKPAMEEAYLMGKAI